MTKSYIVGVNLPIRALCHESGVALIDAEGEVVFAVNEERLTRRKLDGGFPERSVEAMYAATGVRPEQIAWVAVPSLSTTRQALRFADFLLRERLAHLVRPSTWRTLLRVFVSESGTRPPMVDDEDVGPNATDTWSGFIGRHFPSAKIARIDHHVAHAAGAYFTSPWPEALVVTLDGAGNMVTSIVADGAAGAIRVVAQTYLPHSLGTLWGSVTRLCGFKSGTRHGGKVTGLAARGEPTRLIGAFRRLVRCDGLRLRVDEGALFDEGQLVPYWNAFEPERLRARVGDASREDLAAAAQLRLEEVATELVANARRRVPRAHVVAAGGVFANVLMNQRVREVPGVGDLYVFPAMSDGGLALGAALHVLARNMASERKRLLPRALRTPYLGPEYSDEEIEACLRARGIAYVREPCLVARVADLLQEGRVVALFQGRMEYGPRALGNRSILCTPTDPSVNDWLNARLRRSEFMPFAPVTLKEQSARCYVGVEPNPVAARYMTITYQCTDEMKRLAPACVHVDGTARPQIIDRESNPLYHDILAAFHARTGIPSLINTSFNMHEEPIVCSPDDAVRAFLAAPLDYLAIGPFLCSFEDNRSRASGDAG